MVCVWVRWRSMNVWFGMQVGGVRSRSEVVLGGRILGILLWRCR